MSTAWPGLTGPALLASSPSCTFRLVGLDEDGEDGDDKEDGDEDDLVQGLDSSEAIKRAKSRRPIIEPIGDFR